VVRQRGAAGRALGAPRLPARGGAAGSTHSASWGRKDKGRAGDAGCERAQAVFRDGGPGLRAGWAVDPAAGHARRTKRRRRARCRRRCPAPRAHPTLRHAGARPRSTVRNGGRGGRRGLRREAARARGARADPPRILVQGRLSSRPPLSVPTPLGCGEPPGGKASPAGLNKGDGRQLRRRLGTATAETQKRSLKWRRARGGGAGGAGGASARGADGAGPQAPTGSHGRHAGARRAHQGEGRIRRSCDVGVGGFILVTLGCWFHCRYNYAKLRIQERIARDGIKNKILYESTHLDPERKPTTDKNSS
uniref:Cytochrome c oxidase assembly protein COX20, mitochondrial n=1 Tax=Canis lupus familiaris TaxID=9615 RepID=A0A8I3MZH6_CANLF